MAGTSLSYNPHNGGANFGYADGHVKYQSKVNKGSMDIRATTIYP